MTTSPISYAIPDPAIGRLLSEASRIAAAQGIDFFVCGAYARDIVLEGLHGVRSARATRDVDLALAVGDWDAHDRFFGGLVDAGVLLRSPTLGGSHRIAGSSVTVDSIPFGGIESPPGTVRTPTDHVLAVTGFDDVHRHALVLDIGNDALVRVASLAGLVVLKLIAWRDRGTHGNKDAVDIALVARYYGTVSHGRIVETALDVFEAEDADVEKAGHRLLGRDMADFMSDATRRIVETMLVEALDGDRSSRLIFAMTGIDPDGTGFARHEAALRRVLVGIRDRPAGRYIPG